MAVSENKEKKNALFPSWWNIHTGLWLPCLRVGTQAEAGLGVKDVFLEITLKSTHLATS